MAAAGCITSHRPAKNSSTSSWLWAFGARWLDLDVRDYDPAVVLWAWAKTVEVDRLPPDRVVVRFDVFDEGRRSFWMILARP
jgi:hypothetical protein